MAGRIDPIEILARTTDLLLKGGDPDDLGRRVLGHAGRCFGATSGILYHAHAEHAVLTHDTALPDPAGLAARVLAELRTANRLESSWRARDLAVGDAGWHRVLAVRDGERDAETVVVLGFPPGQRLPSSAGTRLLQRMVHSTGIALTQAFRFAEIHRRAEQFAVQAEALQRIHRALEHHSREIERNLAERSRFFAAISHELRTPINAILGYNQLLQQGAYEQLRPAQRDVAARIGASAEQLLALVSDVLDFSKIDAGRVDIHWAPVEIRPLVLEAAAAVEVSARLKGLDLQVDCPPDLPAITTDRSRVRQILLNLLANAVKFTPSGGVTIAVRQGTPDHAPIAIPAPDTASADGWIQIHVRDTGIGIPPNQIPAIFGEFVQLGDPRSGGVQGAGLGLAISRRLARMLGGDLTAESQQGVGTTFTLVLPCPGPRVDTRATNG